MASAVPGLRRRAALPGLAGAEGYLAQTPEKLELGPGGSGYGVSQKDYQLALGKGLSPRDQVRRASRGEGEPPLQNRDEREGKAETFSAPIRPGEYAWACRGLEGRGMAGKVIVK